MNMPRKVLIMDPASGWMYGFPAPIDLDKETVEEVMDRHNYPEELRNLPVRYWESEVEYEDD